MNQRESTTHEKLRYVQELAHNGTTHETRTNTQNKETTSQQLGGPSGTTRGLANGLHTHEQRDQNHNQEQELLLETVTLLSSSFVLFLTSFLLSSRQRLRSSDLNTTLDLLLRREDHKGVDHCWWLLPAMQCSHIPWCYTTWTLGVLIVQDLITVQLDMDPYAKHAVVSSL